MPNIYLTVTYGERTAAKALGARWDAEARKWYVPDGLELTPFSAWLPREISSNSSGLVQSSSKELAAATPKGVSLSKLLAGVAAAVADAYRSGVWTIVDVVNVSARGHVYLEVAERSASGTVLAKTRAMIWSRVAEVILPEFERSTGMHLAPGIKLLVRAKPAFHAEHGFGLEIDAVDPQYTLGDLEAKKREIRTRLKSEGLFDKNRDLRAPWDFNKILVVAPAGAAGLGDFEVEAKRMQEHGVCHFFYAHSRFQGEGAAAEICACSVSALKSCSQSGTLPDVIVIIRGGGATNELAWLNEYCLARFICEAPVPVFTGIGHQRDSTLLDEVAHTTFDTPSKVIAAIERTVWNRAAEARAAFEEITATALRSAALVRADSERLFLSVTQQSRLKVVGARQASQSLISEVRDEANRAIRVAAGEASRLHNEVREDAQLTLALARRDVPLLWTELITTAVASASQAKTAAQHLVRQIIERAENTKQRGRTLVQTTFDQTAHGARTKLHDARATTQALMREVTGQGPEKTLARGFAIVLDQNGKAIGRAAQAREASALGLRFQDGIVPVNRKEE